MRSAHGFLLAWGLAASLAMLYFLGLWLAEPPNDAQGKLLLGFAAATAAAAWPCLALPVLAWRERSRLTRNRIHVLLTPTAIAGALLAVAGLVALEGA